MDGMVVIDASSIDSALIGGCYTMPLRILRTYRFSLYSISSSMRAGRTLPRNPPWSSASGQKGRGPFPQWKGEYG